MREQVLEVSRVQAAEHVGLPDLENFNVSLRDSSELDRLTLFQEEDFFAKPVFGCPDAQLVRRCFEAREAALGRFQVTHSRWPTNGRP